MSRYTRGKNSLPFAKRGWAPPRDCAEFASRGLNWVLDLAASKRIDVRKDGKAVMVNVPSFLAMLDAMPPAEIKSPWPDHPDIVGENTDTEAA